MKWIGERINFVDQKDKLTIVILPPRVGFQRYLMLIWMAFWLFVGVVVMLQFFQEYTQKEKLVLFIFMSFWIYFAVRVGRSLLYLFFGREFVKVDENALYVKQATGRYGSSYQYFLENISKFQLVSVKENSFQSTYENAPWVRGTNKLQFEYMGKTRSFGRKLSEKDAEILFKLITKRIEQYLRRKN